MPKRKKRKLRRSSQKGRLNAVKNLLTDKNVRELIIEIIQMIIERR